MDRPRPGRPIDPRIAFAQRAIAEWQLMVEMHQDYWMVYDEPPTTAWLWRLQTLECAHNAAEAEAMNKVKSDMDNANGSRTTTSRS